MTQSHLTKVCKDKNLMTLLSNMAAEKSELFFDRLGVDYRYSRNKIMGCCPIHGGDNQNAFCMYPDGDIVKGFWRCRTHKCESVFTSTFLGCLRGIVSHQQHGWHKKGDKRTSFPAIVKWVSQILKVDPSTLKVDPAQLEKNRFISQMSNFIRQENNRGSITKSQVRSTLNIPSPYYLSRGYTASILDKYDIGDCKSSGREMSGRAVVPVYDDSGKMMVGCAGRSINDQWPKWKNNQGFDCRLHLYNYWFAREHIMNSQVAILVEGPGDVWRLEESGIHNSVAMFGVTLQDEQQILLERSGATSIIVILDNDENNAGQNACKLIKEQLERYFRLYFITPSKNDIADLNTDEITSDILPYIQGIENHDPNYCTVG